MLKENNYYLFGKMKKQKAFTLLEMIVVMMLMALITGISFYAYQIISSQYHSYQLSMNQNNQLLLFQKTVIQDISKSEYLEKTAEGFQCIFPEATIKYNYAGDSVIRTINVSDTFFFKIQNDSASFFNKTTLSVGDVIQKLNFTVTIDGDTLYYVFAKDYGADVLMKLNQ